jgi:hypothetical protein
MDGDPSRQGNDQKLRRKQGLFTLLAGKGKIRLLAGLPCVLVPSIAIGQSRGMFRGCDIEFEAMSGNQSVQFGSYKVRVLQI